MDRLEFTPKCVLPYQEGYIVVGIDGELQKLDKNYTPLLKHVKPFPTPIRDATISKNTLIATWLDPELLLARIAAIDLTNEETTTIETFEVTWRYQHYEPSSVL